MSVIPKRLVNWTVGHVCVGWAREIGEPYLVRRHNASIAPVFRFEVCLELAIHEIDQSCRSSNAISLDGFLLTTLRVQRSLYRSDIVLLARDEPIQNICFCTVHIERSIGIQAVYALFDGFQLVLKFELMKCGPVVAVAQRIVKWKR